MKNLHAEYVEYTGDPSEGENHVVYDPHGFGLVVIRKLAHLRAYREVNFNEPGFVEKVDLRRVITKIIPSGDNDYKVHVAAPRNIWDTVSRYCTYLEGLENETEGFL